MIWLLLIVHISAKLGSKEINPRELEDQFMMDEEMLPEDLPEHKRAKPQIDIENVSRCSQIGKETRVNPF